MKLHALFQSESINQVSSILLLFATLSLRDKELTPNLRCRNPKSGHPQAERAKPITSLEDTRNSLLNDGLVAVTYLNRQLQTCFCQSSPFGLVLKAHQFKMTNTAKKIVRLTSSVQKNKNNEKFKTKRKEKLESD